MITVISSDSNQVSDGEVIISTSRRPMTTHLQSITSDLVILVHSPDRRIMGNLESIHHYLDSRLDLTVVLGNERCDMFSDYEKARPSATEDTTLLVHTHKIYTLYVVAINRDLMRWLSQFDLSDDELFRHMERAIRCGRFNVMDRKRDIRAHSLYPSPLGIDVRSIGSREDLRLLDQCVKPDELTPVEIDKVYYFFGVIIAFVAILVVISVYIIVKRIS